MAREDLPATVLSSVASSNTPLPVRRLVVLVTVLFLSLLSSTTYHSNRRDDDNSNDNLATKAATSTSHGTSSPKSAAVSHQEANEKKNNEAVKVPLGVHENQHQNEQDQHEVEVVWLMSFGGSGTSYTLTNIEKMTGTSTATNYGRDFVRPVPVLSGRSFNSSSDDAVGTSSTPVFSSPPFWHKPDSLRKPTRYALTKTHCGGYAMSSVSPSEYWLSYDDFETMCRTGTAPRPGQQRNQSQPEQPTFYEVTYSRADIPIRRAVHVIRSPFDNIVARWHLASKRLRRRWKNEQSPREGLRGAGDGKDGISGNGTGRNGTVKLQEEIEIDNSPGGFADWCNDLDEQLHQRQSQDNHRYPQLASLYRQYDNLMCKTEWFKYVQWHNRAVQVTQSQQEHQPRASMIKESMEALPVFHLHYENYSNPESYSTTLHQLIVDFLDLPIVDTDGIPFEGGGKSYRNDYFERGQRKLAARFVQEMASPQVWALLKHYFEDDAIVLEEHTNEQGAGDLGNGTRSVFMKNNETTEVALLLSFPNSGTSYTITNLEQMARVSTASNYAMEFESLVPVRPGLEENGPFVHNPGLPLSKFTLTKSHAKGYCIRCGPRWYVHTIDTFLEGCVTGAKSEVDGRIVETAYDSSVPTKIVHLLRSPYSNIVARMHLAIKRKRRSADKLASFTNTKEGLASWCADMDERYLVQEKETDLISAEVKEAWKDLPCRSDWFRYVQWHNLALEVTKRLQLPSHYLYYEDYGWNYNRTVQDLFDFLGDLRAVAEPIPFEVGKTYLDLFDNRTIRVAARFVRTFATPDSWLLLERYFEGIIL